MIYFDTSALLKLYVREPGSFIFRRQAAHLGGLWFTSRITYAETQAALARIEREQRLTRRTCQRIRRQFESEWTAWQIVEVTAEVLEPTSRLVATHGLRGFDAIQLCSALWIEGPVFATFDQRLRRAALAEGLTVFPDSR